MAEKGVNGAALGVAADDDVVHAQIHLYGKSDGGGGGVGIAPGRWRGNDVADVFNDEQITGFAVSDKLSSASDAGIRSR